MDWKRHYKARQLGADGAVAQIRDGHRVFLDGNAAMPHALVEALIQHAQDLSAIELNHLLIFGQDPFGNCPAIHNNAWFLGPGIRDAVNSGRADYIPVFLSEIANLVRGLHWPIDVALIHTTPPDRHGFMSYGIEVSNTKPCAEAAKCVIAQVNRQMPRTIGDCFVHVSDVDYFVEADEALLEIPVGSPSPVEMQIGQYVAELIEDEATLQFGIGGIPNAVLDCLQNKRDLGIHTEMFSDGVLPLIESGVFTNQKKKFHRGKIISGFAMGSKKLYEYLDNNPLFEYHPSHYTNDPFIIACNHKMTAINSALQVDLSGQVCSDSIGHRIYSGIGGQMDFIRGAARASQGKPIIALPSTAKGGQLSRIVAQLSPGAGVVTSRGDVRYVVTEYGIANLFGKNLRQRAQELIAIAHPDFRSDLHKACFYL